MEDVSWLLSRCDGCIVGGMDNCPICGSPAPTGPEIAGRRICERHHVFIPAQGGVVEVIGDTFCLREFATLTIEWPRGPVHLNDVVARLIR